MNKIERQETIIRNVVKWVAKDGQEFDTEVNPAKTLINSLTLRDGQTYTLNFTSPSVDDLSVSLSEAIEVE